MRSKGTFYSRATLMRIWRIINENPLNTYLVSDFGKSRVTTKNHLRILESLGLIKKVEVMFENPFNKGRRNLIGWRLNKHYEVNL